MLIWKIAWRNLWRHKGKNLVIGVILFFGAFVMTVGNAIIEGARQGMEENMVNSFTGHLVLAAAHEKKEDVFSFDKSLKVIPNYPEVKQVLEVQESIERFLPITSGRVEILNEAGLAGTLWVFGVNIEEYQNMFHQNIVPIAGSVPPGNERGILLSNFSRSMLLSDQKLWIIPEGEILLEEHLPPKVRAEKDRVKIRSNLVLMASTDIRIPVKGIIRLQNFQNIWGAVNFMDIESYRECFGYITAANNAVDLSEKEQTVLAMDEAEMDDIFATAESVTTAEIGTKQYDVKAMQQQTYREDVKVNLDTGAYNLVLVKLRQGVPIEEGAEHLRRVLADRQAEVKVLTWKQAVGMLSQFASLTQGALFVFVLFIFFVAMIVIINTLSMAAIERTVEIGMMRAIGARKNFVSGMFFAETTVLSMLFGGTGIAVGVFVVWGLAALNISTTGNDMLNLLAASDTFHPIVNIPGFGLNVGQLLIVTLLAMLYPIVVARKITPLEAISRE